jgi:hypothetical protein
MIRLLTLTVLVWLAGSCTETRPIISDSQVWTCPEEAHDSAITHERFVRLQAERNFYRKMVLCYGEWFQDHPSDSMPDCHGNY